MFSFSGPAYEDDFLRFCRQNEVPIDFWTFHDYCIDSADPYYYVRVADATRALLDDHGFERTEIILDEWNVLGFDLDLLTTGGRAAFTAAALVYMQDSPIDEQTYYMGPNHFGEDGRTPNKIGQALIALGSMKATPVRLGVDGADTQGFAVQAGCSPDGRTINVVIVNYEVPLSLRGARATGDVIPEYNLNLLPRRDFDYQNNDGLDLQVTGLRPEARYRVERYRINDTWDHRLLSTEFVEGDNITVTGRLSAPGIEHIVITDASPL
jgi:hypothetical protein